jgi:hypothetical protein
MAPHPVDVGVALIAQTQDGNCSIAQVNHLGGDSALVRRRIVAGRWLRPAPGVIGLPGFPSTPRSTLWVALLDAGPPAMASHRAAAALHRIDGFHLDDPCVLVPHGSHHQSAVGHVHQTRRMPEPVTINGIATTPLVRTVLDLASTLSPLALGRVIDEVTLRSRPNLDAIVRGHEWMVRTRRTGARTLTRALDGRTHGYEPSRSELERMLDVVIATLPVPLPRREVRLRNRANEPHRVDRLFEDPPLIVEGDGRLWHARLSAMEKDRRRDRHALLLGYPTVRYGWHELTVEAAEVRTELLAILTRRSV